MIGKSTSAPAACAMSGVQRRWFSTESTEIAIGLVLRAANSLESAAVRPSSVVQTGVKSAGWLNSTAQEPAFQSWKDSRPCVGSAGKGGGGGRRRVLPGASPFGEVLPHGLDL